MDSAGASVTWPKTLIPLACTGLFVCLAWLFLDKVEADRQAIVHEASRMEAQAVDDASLLLVAAADATDAVVKMAANTRNVRQRDLGVEAREVMQACHRLLTSLLEKDAGQGPKKRPVSPFPAGFDGIRHFLEIVPVPSPEKRIDPLVMSLRAQAPELAALIPSGGKLAVIEDHAHELLSIGGGTATSDGLLVASASRDFTVAGYGGRLLTLRVELSAPDNAPPPTAAGIAAELGQKFGNVRSPGLAWRGWLLEADGRPAAAFPVALSEGESPAGLRSPVWNALDDGRLARFTEAPPVGALPWRLGLSQIMEPFPEPPDSAQVFLNDTAWSVALSASGLSMLAAWGWFVFSRTKGSRGNIPVGSGAPLSATGRRLVRDSLAVRAVPEDQGLILAEIGRDGRAQLSVPCAGDATAVMPRGSLARLQAMHRGQSGSPGSRVLDRARSPLLKELARRVRPVAPGLAESSKPIAAAKRSAPSVAPGRFGTRYEA